MSLPDYWLTRPPMELDKATQQHCEALLNHAMGQGAALPLDYTLAIPKWQFLCYIVERHDVVLHGSGNPAITTFEPRSPVDLSDFGAQHAVYAAADGIWPLFFAIIDRQEGLTLINGAIYQEESDGTIGPIHYLFSISRHLIPLRPYRTGVVYLLPGSTFVHEPPLQLGRERLHSTQRASPVPVQPLAKLVITPDDFPFLSQIRSHNDEHFEAYYHALRQGATWPD